MTESENGGRRSPFWLDYARDRAQASDGCSRYGVYLGRESGFEDIESEAVGDDADPTAAFAVLAWRTARSPVMSPPFVRSHARVSSAVVERSECGSGRLVARVGLVCLLPAEVRGLRPAGGGWFRVPSRDPWSDVYHAPCDRELERSPHLSASLLVEWQFDAGVLPAVPRVPGPGPTRVSAAAACVEAIARELNVQIGPIIEAMEPTP